MEEKKQIAKQYLQYFALCKIIFYTHTNVERMFTKLPVSSGWYVFK